jgi:hypothetical protein
MMIHLQMSLFSCQSYEKNAFLYKTTTRKTLSHKDYQKYKQNHNFTSNFMKSILNLNKYKWQQKQTNLNQTIQMKGKVSTQKLTFSGELCYIFNWKGSVVRYNTWLNVMNFMMELSKFWKIDENWVILMQKTVDSKLVSAFYKIWGKIKNWGNRLQIFFCFIRLILIGKLRFMKNVYFIPAPFHIIWVFF